MLGNLFLQIINMSFTAGLIILAVLAVRLALRKAPKIFSYCLWAVVLFRFLCPVSFSVPVSFLGTLGIDAAGGQVSYFPEGFGKEVLLAEERAGRGSESREFTKDRQSSGNDGGSIPAEKGEGKTLPGIPALWKLLDEMMAFFWPEDFSVLLQLGLVFWLAGMGGMVLYGFRSMGKLKSVLRYAHEELTEGNMDVYRTSEISMPFVMGILHPRIYLPAGLEEEEKAYILIHERIHIRRGDPLFRILAYAALCIHWFNPLAWVAFFLSERDMEMSCDEAVLRRFGNQIKKEYSNSLLSLAVGSEEFHGISPAFAEGDTDSRIRNVLQYRKPAAFLAGTAAALSLMAAVFLLGNPASASGEAGNDTNSFLYGVITDVESQEGAGSFWLETTAGTRLVRLTEETVIVPYAEFDMRQGLKKGDLVRLILPRDSGALQIRGETISGAIPLVEVMGRGYEMEYQKEKNQVRFTVPIGLAKDARVGDELEIRFGTGETEDSHSAVDGGGLLACTPVLEVDVRHHALWVELSAEDAETFLEQAGFGLACTVVKKEGEEEREPAESSLAVIPAEPSADDFHALTGEILASGEIADEECWVYVSSISYPQEYVELSGGKGWTDADQPLKLPFSSICTYWVAENGRYVERDLQDFSIAVEEGLNRNEVPLYLVLEDGMIVEAFFNHVRDD